MHSALKLELPKIPDVLGQLIETHLGDLKAVNQIILSELGTSLPLAVDLAQHLLQAGGKRIRPLITLMSARLFGYEGTYHIRLAAAIEYIHTATLLHDDVVDGSAERRGNPTANLVWGNKAAILVGDFLFSRAFQLMVSTPHGEVLDILSGAAARITEGELMQLSVTEGVMLSQEKYFQIIRAKTAALFEAAAHVGAILSGTSPETQDNMRRFGHSLGCIFQLADDMLDYDLGIQKLGKKVGDDFYEGKITLPVLLAYEKASENEQAFWTTVFVKKTRTPEDFNQAVLYLRRHNVPQEMREKAALFYHEAEAALSLLGELPAKHEFESLLQYCFDRCADI